MLQLWDSHSRRTLLKNFRVRERGKLRKPVIDFTHMTSEHEGITHSIIRLYGPDVEVHPSETSLNVGRYAFHRAVYGELPGVWDGMNSKVQHPLET